MAVVHSVTRLGCTISHSDAALVVLFVVSLLAIVAGAVRGFARSVVHQPQSLHAWSARSRPRKPYIMRCALIPALFALLHLVASSTLARHDVSRRQTTNTSSLLDVFQVEKPVPIDSSTDCLVQQVLMDHVFAYSYGIPYVGNYTPPTCEFNSVVINFTVTSAGRQFDRLAIMYLGDIEVWRTSTAEPTSTGIIWTYTKDMTQYLSLWKEPQTLIFDLGNLIDDTYTASFNTTLTATFFYEDPSDAPYTANLILPISTEQGSNGSASVFTVPDQNATVQQTLPSNVVRASVSISANGQIDEEFWATNVLQSDVYTFNSTAGQLLGYGPFREVQLYIDDMLAGVVWPFLVIFTGGVVPGLWKPIVGIDAFDLRESEIDISPFLPYLSDGQPHTYTIKVVGVDDNGGNGPATLSESSLGSYWLVTGKIFLFYGASHGGNGSTNYTGTYPAPTISAPEPDVFTSHEITQLSNGTNSSLAYSVRASRSLSVSSEYGNWSQSLSYSNTGLVTDAGFTQTNTQSTTGSQSASGGNTIEAYGVSFSSNTSFSYPITVNTTYVEFDTGVHIDAAIDRGLEINSTGRPDISVYTLVAGPSYLDTTQFGTGHYSSVTNHTYSYGDTTQEFTETSNGTTYERDVHAVNLTIVSDSVGISPAVEAPLSSYMGPSAVRPMEGDSRGGVRAFIGRGPGTVAVAEA